MKDIDEIDKTILRDLKDGRKPYSFIADELSLSENTIRSRANRLIGSGTLSLEGLVNPEMVPGVQVVYMGVKLNSMELEKKAEEFCRLKGVISAAIVTGRYDLMITLMLNEEDGLTLLDFFSEELKKIDSIQDVETFVVYQSKGLFVPYVL